MELDAGGPRRARAEGSGGVKNGKTSLDAILKSDGVKTIARALAGPPSHGPLLSCDDVLAQVAFVNAAVHAARERELGDVLGFFAVRIANLRAKGDGASADELESAVSLLAQGEHR